MYKIVQDREVVDIGSREVYIKLQDNGVPIICSRDNAHGIISSDGKQIFALREGTIFGRTVTIEEITEEEYNFYKEQMEAQNDERGKAYESITQVVEVLSFAISSKIREMSAVCNQTIVRGVDVTLSDGSTRHFSMSIDDQLNLSSIQARIFAGEEWFGYHSDGGDCVFYSKEDMMAIITASESWKTYHITYFNSLRKYIKSLKTLEEVRAIEYGMEIPEEYQTVVLKTLLSN